MQNAKRTLSERTSFLSGDLVGAGRFELPTSRTRTVRATKLRYAPETIALRAPENVLPTRFCQADEG